MKRLLPNPLASLSLWVIWLVMNASIAPGQLVLGALVALAIPLATRALLPVDLHFRNPAAFARLTLLVVYDIVVANVQVARLILGPVARLRPAFVAVPLSLRNRYAISTLASIITLTPGTVSAELSHDRRTLFVHALDVDDAEALVAEIKARYETPLAEIMEC